MNVVWSEGLLLTQQHFQQFQAYLEQHSNALFHCDRPFVDGLLLLRINEDVLLNGVFQLEKCQGFFKSGDRIHVPQPIKLAIEQSGPVFLCLTEQPSLADLPGYTCDAERPKYRLCSQEVADDYDRHRKQLIVFRQENYFLTQDTQQYPSAQVIKLAEVSKNTLGGFCLSDDFIPPCLNLFCWHAFESYLHQLLHYLQSILSLFENSYYQVDSYVPFFLKQWLATLHCAFFQKHYHPWQFYQDFYQCIVAISSVVPVAYDHHHLSSVVQYVDKKIKSILPMLVPKKVMILTLHAQTDCLFYSDSLDAVIVNNMALYLQVSFPLSDPRLGLFCQQVKVAAISDIESTMNAALPGMQLSVADPPPKEFKPQGCYLLLNATGKYWQRIVNEKQLAVFLTNDFLGVEIKLIAREV